MPHPELENKNYLCKILNMFIFLDESGQFQKRALVGKLRLKITTLDFSNGPKYYFFLPRTKILEI